MNQLYVIRICFYCFSWFHIWISMCFTNRKTSCPLDKCRAPEKYNDLGLRSLAELGMYPKSAALHLKDFFSLSLFLFFFKKVFILLLLKHGILI